MARRSDHNKDELNDLIINAAEEIVLKEGFSSLSARKIAKKIGYTPGTLYNFFKDQNELILFINARTLDNLYEILVRETCSCKNAKDKIEKIAFAYVDFSIKNHNLWTMLFEFHYPRPTGGKLPKWYQSKIEKNFDLLNDAFKDVIKNKDEAHRKSKLFWASLHGICSLSITGKLNTIESDNAYTLAESLVKVFSISFK